MADENVQQNQQQEELDRIKISELPEATSYSGLWTVGTDDRKKSVKVPLAGVISPPIIGQDGFWYVYNLTTKTYTKTNDKAIGKSAYQYAVEAGYEGTEAQYMQLLTDIFHAPIFLTEERFKSLTPAERDPNRIYMTYEEVEQL